MCSATLHKVTWFSRDQDHCFSVTQNLDRRVCVSHPSSSSNNASAVTSSCLVVCMLRCLGCRCLSPSAPPSSFCRFPRLLSGLPQPPVAAMGETAGGGSAEAKAPKSKHPPSPASAHKDQAYLDAVIQKRVKLFETIQAQQKAERLKLDGEPIKCDYFVSS